jgi:GNAT superfamily N-acetyltransferase
MGPQLSDTPGRVGTLEAQKLLDVPVRGGFAVWLDENWRAELQGLLERCSQEVALVYGQAPDPGAASRILGDLPPGHTFEDKFVVGVFDAQGRMSGVLAVVRDHPAPGHWTVDVLLVAPEERGRGLAREMLASLEGWVRSEGGVAIHLETKRHNPAGAAFALRAGFERAGDPGGASGGRYVRRVG